MKKIALIINIFLLSIICFSSVQAADKGIGSAFTKAKEVADQSSYNYDISLERSAGDLISLALSVLGIIFIGLMIYAGFTWMTAAGNEKRIEKSKSIIIESAIGLVIVLTAYAITYFIITSFKDQVSL